MTPAPRAATLPLGRRGVWGHGCVSEGALTVALTVVGPTPMVGAAAGPVSR